MHLDSVIAESLVYLTCINIVKCISHSVQAFKEVIVVDPLRVRTHPVLVCGDLEGRIHLLYSHSCCVALHFLFSQKRFQLLLMFYLKIQHGNQKKKGKEEAEAKMSYKKHKRHVMIDVDTETNNSNYICP